MSNYKELKKWVDMRIKCHEDKIYVNMINMMNERLEKNYNSKKIGIKRNVVKMSRDYNNNYQISKMKNQLEEKENQIRKLKQELNKKNRDYEKLKTVSFALRDEILSYINKNKKEK